MSVRRKQLLQRKREKIRSRRHGKAASSFRLSSNDVLDSLDFTSPRQLFCTLVSPFSERKFFDSFWESNPLIIRRSTTGCSLQSTEYRHLFSLQDLRQLVIHEQVQFGRNVGVCRYVNGERESLNKSGFVTVEDFNTLWTKERATFQFHQPQQFKDVLWRMLTHLETYFSCLVGSNVYLTPSGSQGLAPHYDDVEVLILQLEGKKHWRLYPPPVPLPDSCSKDLRLEDIGEPTHDLILEAGDVMYFPRGTVHHADTPSDVSHSTHLTISTYQNHSLGRLLNHLFPAVLDKCFKEELLFRTGLPLNYLSLPGGCGHGSQVESLTEAMESATDIFIKYINHCLSVVQEEHSLDFIASRLPPHYSDVRELEPRGPTPGIDSIVYLCWPDYTYLHCGRPEDEWIYVYHSLNNDRRSHMMTSERCNWPKGLKFPKKYKESLQLIFSGYKKNNAGIKVSNLPLPTDEQISLVMTLWAEGLLALH